MKEQTMKNLVAASAILALFAGVASAASVQGNERPDVAPAVVTTQNVEQVASKSVYSPKDLARFDLNANDTVNITAFPSSGIVDGPSRDN